MTGWGECRGPAAPHTRSRFPGRGGPASPGCCGATAAAGFGFGFATGFAIGFVRIFEAGDGDCSAAAVAAAAGTAAAAAGGWTVEFGAAVEFAGAVEWRRGLPAECDGPGAGARSAPA